jgi:quinol monooxygenase YgiN
MPATVHVLARYTARPGKEDALKAVLIGLVPPTRRELGCYQYDLLVDNSDPREFCFVERWDDDAALDQHLETSHLKKALTQIEDLVETPPEIRRYTLV